jgi:hypothetical protein
MNLGLSATQVADRRRYVQAGDADAVMAGDWQRLWRIKRGEEAEDDLSGKLPVQLGSYTEPLNLAWCQKQTGRKIYYYTDNPLMAAIWKHLANKDAISPECQVSGRYPWMACNLDGMSTTPQGHRCVIDAKHVGRADEQALLRYSAGMTHQATVMGVDWWALSFFVGNSRWEVVYQEVDAMYQAELVAKEEMFWSYVVSGDEPPDMRPSLPPKPQPKLRQISVPIENDEVYEALCRQNNWLPEACGKIRTFGETHAAATRHAITREELKATVPDDVGELVRGRFRLARTKAGAVTMSLKPMEDDDGRGGDNGRR